MHLKISFAKWQPFCPGGDELSHDVLWAHVNCRGNSCCFLKADDSLFHSPLTARDVNKDYERVQPPLTCRKTVKQSSFSITWGSNFSCPPNFVTTILFSLMVIGATKVMMNAACSDDTPDERLIYVTHLTHLTQVISCRAPFHKWFFHHNSDLR